MGAEAACMGLRHACLSLARWTGQHTGRHDNWRIGGWFRLPSDWNVWVYGAAYPCPPELAVKAAGSSWMRSGLSGGVFHPNPSSAFLRLPPTISDDPPLPPSFLAT